MDAGEIMDGNSSDVPSGMSGTDSNLSPDSSATSLISSPVVGLLPELTPEEISEGILLFLLQVSGPSAVPGNANLNWALSVNLATRLMYVSVDNLYLLNYTQIPTTTGRKLQASSPSASIGEIQPGVVPLPDLQSESRNISVSGTGVYTPGPSMTFLYEVDIADVSYISYVHNQLNSIIATSLLLKDVQAANLSISSIYLLSFEPPQSPAAANTSSVSSIATPHEGVLTIFLVQMLGCPRIHCVPAHHLNESLEHVYV